MAEKVQVVLVELDHIDKCEYCGKVADLRPYGKNGAYICFECGMKPENKKETTNNMHSFMDGLVKSGSEVKQ